MIVQEPIVTTVGTASTPEEAMRLAKQQAAAFAHCAVEPVTIYLTMEREFTMSGRTTLRTWRCEGEYERIKTVEGLHNLLVEESKDQGTTGVSVEEGSQDG